MLQFLVKRLIGLIFVVLGVTFITFILGYWQPDDPIKAAMGQHFNLKLWLQLRHIYGFDLPWYHQYWNFLVRLAHFDLGVSFYYKNRAVWDILSSGVPISLELAFWGTLITLVIGIPAGIWSAVKANSWIDTSNMAVALIFYALPPFVLAAFAQVIVGWINTQFGLSWPVSNWGNPWQYTPEDIQYKLVPIIVYGAAGYAYFARLARTTMLEVLRQDYVRTARAKGLSEGVVIYRHALRNAMIPLITVIGLFLGLLVAGSFFVELIFNIHGIALNTVLSINVRDYPVIQATTILIAIGVVVGNLISDVLYTVVDPRIKLS
ncbi:ABC transporter permease [Tengunoibacter tsumagoiensis]|uniref:Glutathione ABC transporter permease n=1 Tax=Tengunoibacter tsumagoiensis TaxID=2014871 RepID=A0A402A203_9CHLR|nr:ABC transporter permease [Tengunoibacter tsumagoiensis]GCE13079.1 glutathione ABC transporter permease [Tengunoibacter tsumagoiensis]